MTNPRKHKAPLLPAINVMVDVKAEVDKVTKVVCPIPRADMDESEAEGVSLDKVPEETCDTYARVVQRLAGWRRPGPTSGESGSRVSGNQMNGKGERS